MRKRSRPIYRSGFEDELIAQLRLEGVPFDYETETFVYNKPHKYKPDLVFYEQRLLVEAKGYFTAADRAKSLLVRPVLEAEGWELRFVFERAENFLNKNSNTTYADWCDRHEFVWAQGRVPLEWLE